MAQVQVRSQHNYTDGIGSPLNGAHTLSYTRSAAPSTWQQAKQVRLMQPLCCSLFPIMTRTQQLQRQPPVLRHSGCGVNPSSMSQQSISAQAHRWCGQMLACLAVHAIPGVIDSLELATANMYKKSDVRAPQTQQ